MSGERSESARWAQLGGFETTNEETMHEVLKWLRISSTVVGALILALAVLGALGFADFRLCFVPVGAVCIA